MSHDSILWQRIHKSNEQTAHPSKGALTRVARLSGIELWSLALTPRQIRHFRDEYCESCEQELVERWVKRCPDVQVLIDALLLDGLPDTSLYLNALRQHEAHCPRCRALLHPDQC